MSEAIKKFFTQYSTEKILALVITLILWTFSISRNQESRDYTVKLNVIIHSDQMIVSEPVEQMQVKISGSVFDFARINEKDLFVNIDISSQKPGKFTRFLDAKMLTFAKDLDVEKFFPSEISIRTAKRAEKVVNIEPWLDGQPPSGWKITGYKVTPEKVTVSGPEKEIAEIDSVTTEKTVLESLNGSVEKELKILMPSIHISTVDINVAKVSITLERDVKTRTYPHVPLVLDSDDKAELSPGTVSVTLRAPKDILDKLTHEGFSAFIKNNPDKTYFRSKEFYLKDMPSEVDLSELKKNIDVSVRKVTNDKKTDIRN